VQLSKQATNIVVGAFVVIGAAIVVGATMWAREAHLGRGQATVTARFREVGGAGVGTNAYIRGVRAGRVSALELGDDGWVRARIALEPSVRLPHDPVVVLGAASLVGEWQATITSRDAAPDDPAVLRELVESAGERGVLPGATLSDVQQLAAGAGRILDDVGAVAGSARRTFDDSTARELRETVANVRALSASLLATSDALRAMARRVDAASADSAVPHTMRDVAATASDLRATAAELRSLAARTTGGSGTLGRVLADPSLYVGADSLVTELRALVADVKAHPKRYVNVRVF
jgi:phospholipid/cholesterol/gamma-HCH transport system substrate-binding protein